MPNTNSYRLDIYLNGAGAGTQKGSAKTPKSISQNKGEIADNTAKALEIYAVNQIAKPLVKSAISYATSHVYMYTGSQDLQDKINLGLEVVSTVKGIGTATVSGFAVGGVAGAVVGFVSGLVSVGVDTAKKQAEYNYNRQWEAVNLGILRDRAGASFNRSRYGS